MGYLFFTAIGIVVLAIILNMILSGTNRKALKHIVRKPSKDSDSFKPATRAVPTAIKSSSIYIDIPGFLGTGPVSPTPDGGWTLNPKSTLPLAVYGISQTIATELKKLLDAGCSLGTDAHARSILPIIALSNLRCKEIDDYITSFRPQYFKRIEQLKQATPEWASASSEDQEKLLAEFSQEAIDSLDVIPYGDLEALFEDEPTDVTVDESLILRFGNESLFFYLGYAQNLKKIHAIPRDHCARSEFEKLVRLGLASNGRAIPLAAILGTLKLRELNELVAGSNQQPLRTREKAIEFLMQLPDVDERIGTLPKVNDLFQLKPLPEGLSAANLSRTTGAWGYANQVALLIAHTYGIGELAAQAAYSHQEAPDNIFWKVLPAEDPCPYCKRAASRGAQRAHPKVPLHIGCRCGITPEVQW